MVYIWDTSQKTQAQLILSLLHIKKPRETYGLQLNVVLRSGPHLNLVTLRLKLQSYSFSFNIMTQECSNPNVFKQTTFQFSWVIFSRVLCKLSQLREQTKPILSHLTSHCGTETLSQLPFPLNLLIRVYLYTWTPTLWYGHHQSWFSFCHVIRHEKIGHFNRKPVLLGCEKFPLCISILIRLWVLWAHCDWQWLSAWKMSFCQERH